MEIKNQLPQVQMHEWSFWQEETRNLGPNLQHVSCTLCGPNDGDELSSKFTKTVSKLKTIFFNTTIHLPYPNLYYYLCMQLTYNLNLCIALMYYVNL